MSNANTPKQAGQAGGQGCQQSGKWVGPRRKPSNTTPHAAAEKANSSHGGGLLEEGHSKAHANLYNTMMEDVVNHVCIEFKDGELIAWTITTGVR